MQHQIRGGKESLGPPFYRPNGVRDQSCSRMSSAISLGPIIRLLARDGWAGFFMGSPGLP